jgi:hypothetical protein
VRQSDDLEIKINESLTQFWKQTNGEILVIYPPQGTMYIDVGMTLSNGSLLVEMDFANKPKQS